MITNQMLAAYPFLCRLSPASRQLVEAGAKVESAGRGTTLLRKGDRLRGLYLLLSGQLRVFVLTDEGTEATLYQLGAGESCPLALNALISENHHQAWVEVESRTARWLFVPLAIFRNLYDNEPAVRQFTLEVLSSRISSLMDALENRSVRSLRERLWAQLEKMADPRGEVQTTHAELARTLGSTREVVSRQLGQLRRAGLVETGRGKVNLCPLSKVTQKRLQKLHPLSRR